MARKKKATTTNDSSISNDTTESAITNTNIDVLKYKGSVRVILKKGNKTISSKTYHNRGNDPLYNFLLNCVSGNYADADRPKYIILFHNTGTTPVDNGGLDVKSFKMSTALAVNRIASTTVQITSGATTTTVPGIILHFTIPCSLINVTTYNTVQQAALFSSNKLSISGEDDEKLRENYSVAYNFVNGSVWDPITITSSNGDYNVFIEWVMSFNS